MAEPARHPDCEAEIRIVLAALDARLNPSRPGNFPSVAIRVGEGCEEWEQRIPTVGAFWRALVRSCRRAGPADAPPPPNLEALRLLMADRHSRCRSRPCNQEDADEGRCECREDVKAILEAARPGPGSEDERTTWDRIAGAVEPWLTRYRNDLELRVRTKGSGEGGRLLAYGRVKGVEVALKVIHEALGRPSGLDNPLRSPAEPQDERPAPSAPSRAPEPREPAYAAPRPAYDPLGPPAEVVVAAPVYLRPGGEWFVAAWGPGSPAPAQRPDYWITAKLYDPCAPPAPGRLEKGNPDG